MECLHFHLAIHKHTIKSMPTISHACIHAQTIPTTPLAILSRTIHNIKILIYSATQYIPSTHTTLSNPSPHSPKILPPHKTCTTPKHIPLLKSSTPHNLHYSLTILQRVHVLPLSIDPSYYPPYNPTSHNSRNLLQKSYITT